MKLTRSLAANAMARAKVPTSTTTLRALTRATIARNWRRMADTTNEPIRMVAVWVLIHPSVSGVMKEAPLAPLMRMK